MLPNPFSSGVLLPNSNSVSNIIQTSVSLNPGPGLPQAPVTVYKTPVFQSSQPQNGYNQRPNYGRGSFTNSQNLSFSCDLCDRGFKSKELLDFHISEHVPCGINGCKFVAHPKIVEKHIQMQHVTGLAEKIMRLTTPEEIEKWKEERKRNFPSVQNVARRQAEQKEKLERGEVLYEPETRFGRGGNQRGRGRGRGRGQDRGRGRGRGVYDGDRSNPLQVHQTKQVDKTPSSIPLPTTVAENSIDVKPSTAIPACKRKSDLSDGEIESDDETLEVGVPTKLNALCSLMACYASDSEAEVIPRATVVEEKEVPAPDVVKQDVVCPNEESKVPDQKPKEQKSTRKRPTKRQKKKGAAGTVKPNQLVPTKRLTLLQKLLQGEILHERNVILQCVHYITAQNFFGVGQQIQQQPPQSSEVNQVDIDYNPSSNLDQAAINEKNPTSS